MQMSGNMTKILLEYSRVQQETTIDSGRNTRAYGMKKVMQTQTRTKQENKGK